MDIFDYIDQLSATYHNLLPMSPENQRRWDKKYVWSSIIILTI